MRPTKKEQLPLMDVGLVAAPWIIPAGGRVPVRIVASYGPRQGIS